MQHALQCTAARCLMPAYVGCRNQQTFRKTRSNKISYVAQRAGGWYTAPEASAHAAHHSAIDLPRTALAARLEPPQQPAGPPAVTKGGCCPWSRGCTGTPLQPMARISIMPARRSAPLLAVAVCLLQLLSLGARAQNVLNGEPAAPGGGDHWDLCECGAWGACGGRRQRQR